MKQNEINSQTALGVSRSSGWKNVMSKRELFFPDPLVGFEKMAGFQIFFCLIIIIKFPLIIWKEKAICLQKLQVVVITFLLFNFLEEYLTVNGP